MTEQDMRNVADYYFRISVSANLFAEAIRYEHDLEKSLYCLLLWKQSSQEAWNYLHQIMPSKRLRAMLIAGGSTL